MAIENTQQSGDERATTTLKRVRLQRAVDLGRDVTQEEMAGLIGISRSKYSSLELGTYQPGREMARRIGEVTGQSVGEVIDEYERLMDREPAGRTA